MQINWNYQSHNQPIRLERPRLLWVKAFVLWSVLLLGFSGCTPMLKPQVEAERSVASMLPVADQPNLPDVIKTLLISSDKQYYAQNLVGALATLERALRINPRHAEIWSRMAQIYLEQGNLNQAKQHAKRSNSVIKNNTQFSAFNNKIINSSSIDNIQRRTKNTPVAF